ncbi:flagellar assembly peptidoglycan hydrolase FlgJ [Janthinobacterium agaricidamnosum]|uniref:Peptidoglycan hydrolase FlgJ n=1 Tax=Janthinobacterium agaricidamnosum NBRC 102515 = DSM 9628 TaxID=1349767 RepID=W0V3F8_9BURK|nr:flagellar assembly peptidoglycan hydrolase FlgJ [Janthinobacterium agaricidamnosum]CDG81883.1 flagellar rod assembly protein/muramidase FlgJ [Janthinobacterium agaricidamnosum NBRC 102515 = DSM 9628]
MISQPQSGNLTDLSNKAAYDIKGLNGLRQSAKANDPEAIKGAATQFEAMFLNMMMKSMRDATPQDGIMDNQQTKMYTSMLDQQTSQSMAKRGTGLADMLVRQLSANQQTLALDGASELPSPRSSSMAAALEAFRQQQSQGRGQGEGQGVVGGSAVPAGDKGASTQAPHVRAFQEKLGAHADEASRATGIPAKFMLGQAALETGWGKREIKGRDGSSSHNLFGIKASADWKGKTTDAVTTEYVNGKPQTRVEKFRAYDSYADSFKDYAQLITGNKRYEKVLASAGDASSFAQGLQRAGYATDPNYATKLTRIIKHSLVG